MSIINSESLTLYGAQSVIDSKLRSKNQEQEVFDNYALASASDEELKQLSKQKALYWHREHGGKLGKIAVEWTMPAVDVLIRTSTAKGGFARKLKTGVKETKDWIIFKFIMKAAHKINQKIPFLKKSEENHPILTILTEGILVAVALNVINSKTAKFIEKQRANNTDLFRKFDDFSKALGEKLDKSETGKIINKHVFEPVNKMFKNKPIIAFLVPIAAGFGALMLKGLYDISKIKNKAKEFNQEFIESREQARQQLQDEKLLSEVQGNTLM